MQVDLPQLGTVPLEPNGGLLLADPGSPDDGELRAGPGTTAVSQLLVGYGEVLDRITARPPIVFLRYRCVPERPRLCVIVSRVNRMAAMLAETHVAARLDALLGRGLGARQASFPDPAQGLPRRSHAAQQRQIVLATAIPVTSPTC